MGKIESIHPDGATVYIGDYVASTMSELEDVIGVITGRRPTEKTSELLYLIGMVKLAAFDVQGIIPVSNFTLGAACRVAADTRIESELDDCTVLNRFPWDWTYHLLDTEGDVEMIRA